MTAALAGPAAEKAQRIGSEGGTDRAVNQTYFPIDMGVMDKEGSNMIPRFWFGNAQIEVNFMFLTEV